jgi:hypothetical protein
MPVIRAVAGFIILPSLQFGFGLFMKPFGKIVKMFTFLYQRFQRFFHSLLSVKCNNVG